MKGFKLLLSFEHFTDIIKETTFSFPTTKDIVSLLREGAPFCEHQEGLTSPVMTQDRIMRHKLASSPSRVRLSLCKLDPSKCP